MYPFKGKACLGTLSVDVSSICNLPNSSHTPPHKSSRGHPQSVSVKPIHLNPLLNKDEQMDITTPLSPLSQHLAFVPCCPLRYTTFTRSISVTTPCRRRPRTPHFDTCRARLQPFPDSPSNNQEQPEDDDEEDDDFEYDISYQSLFVDEDEQSFWDDLDARTALRPITEEEKAALRSKLPLRVANFLIRRAEDAERLGDPNKTEESFFGKLLKDLPPDLPEEDDDEDYVFDTVAGPPAFRRRGSSLFGGGDGLPDVKDTSMDADVIDVGPPKNMMGLFVGRVGSIDEQASQVGYGLFALFAVWILIKIFLAFMTFFVSFTFSFFAIFALSAGIFMVFFFFRW